MSLTYSAHRGKPNTSRLQQILSVKSAPNGNSDWYYEIIAETMIQPYDEEAVELVKNNQDYKFWVNTIYHFQHIFADPDGEIPDELDEDDFMEFCKSSLWDSIRYVFYLKNVIEISKQELNSLRQLIPDYRRDDFEVLKNEYLVRLKKKYIKAFL